MLVLLLSSLYIWMTWTCLANNTPPQVSKIQTSLQRVRKLTVRSDQKFNNLEKTKSYLPKLSNTMVGNKRIHGKLNFDEYKGIPIFEIYVRSITGGLWNRFQDLAADTNQAELVKHVLLGGVESKATRPELEKSLMIILLGTGMGGDKVLFQEITSVFPQFKKCKIRDIEYGYRIIENNISLTDIDIKTQEEIDTSIWRLDMTPMNPVISSSASFITVQHKISPEYINQKMLGVYSSSLNPIEIDIKEMARRIISNGLNRFIICSDGSATPTKIDEKDSSSIEYFISGGIILCGLDSEGNIIEQYSLRLLNGGHAITNPFDAELITGLGGILISYWLYELCNSISASFTIELVSDSKALIRFLRIVKMNSTSDLSSSVEIVKTCLSPSIFHLINVLGKCFTFSWVPGHPERRYTDMLE